MLAAELISSSELIIPSNDSGSPFALSRADDSESSGVLTASAITSAESAATLESLSSTADAALEISPEASEAKAVPNGTDMNERQIESEMASKFFANRFVFFIFNLSNQSWPHCIK